MSILKEKINRHSKNTTGFQKNDAILLCILIVLSLSFYLGYHLLYQKQGDYVTVTVNGSLYTTLPLNHDTQQTIPGKNSGWNKLIIQNGSARIEDANCPDRLCVHQIEISAQGETLVCLPNKVIVTVSAKKEPTLDGMAR